MVLLMLRRTYNNVTLYNIIYIILPILVQCVIFNNSFSTLYVGYTMYYVLSIILCTTYHREHNIDKVSL